MQKDTCTPDCGDGRKLGNEACDDSNTSSGDGYIISANKNLDVILIVPKWKLDIVAQLLAQLANQSVVMDIISLVNNVKMVT